jgi:hypothetical protein
LPPFSCESLSLGAKLRSLESQGLSQLASKLALGSVPDSTSASYTGKVLSFYSLVPFQPQRFLLILHRICLQLSVVLKSAKCATVRPPTPRLSLDISVVLSFLFNRYHLGISISEPSRAMATLIAPVTSWRPQPELGKISLSSVLFIDDEG